MSILCSSIWNRLLSFPGPSYFVEIYLETFFFDFARDQRASSFPVDLFLNTKDCFVRVFSFATSKLVHPLNVILILIVVGLMKTKQEIVSFKGVLLLDCLLQRIPAGSLPGDSSQNPAILDLLEPLTNVINYHGLSEARGTGFECYKQLVNMFSLDARYGNIRIHLTNLLREDTGVLFLQNWIIQKSI